MALLAQANGVNTDLELAVFGADHGAADRALARARVEWRQRRSIHAADALAWALYRAGRFERALRASHQALRLGTRSAGFHFHAGMIAARLGREAQARAHLRRARRINGHFSVLQGAWRAGRWRAWRHS